MTPKKSNTNSTKTTALPKPETTIVANVQVTIIIDDELSEEEAKGILWDVLEGTDVDKMEIKQVKRFFREV